MYNFANSADTDWSNGRPQLQTLICTTSPPERAAWNALVGPRGGDYRVGLNISEPIPYDPTVPGLPPYYPIPTHNLNPNDTGGNGLPGFRAMTRDSYKDFTRPGKTLPDKPFDIANLPSDPPAYANPVLTDPIRPHFEDGTHEDVRTVYLQRLAEPDMAYDPVDNPYITIDWMPVDLTVFNGEDEPDNAAATPVFAFQSRYKDGGDVSSYISSDLLPATIQNSSAALSADIAGGSRKGVGSSLGTQMLSASTSSLVRSQPYPAGAVATTRSPALPNFKYRLGYAVVPAIAGDTNDPNYRATSSVSLGYLNVGRPLGNFNIHTIPAGRQFDGFEPPISLPASPYLGSPQNSQNSLFWFNRLFASPYELMYVPAFGPGQIGQNATLSNVQHLYASDAAKTGLTAEGRFGPFGAFLDFFNSSHLKTANMTGLTGYWQRAQSPPPTATSQIPQNPDLHLLFDLIETPQHYIDSQKYLMVVWQKQQDRDFVILAAIQSRTTFDLEC